MKTEQKNIQSIMKHKLLNLLTALTLQLSEENTKSIRTARKLIKLLNILIEYESIFLKEKPEFFIQTFSLKELIESILIMCEEKIKEDNVIVKSLGTDYKIKFDRYYILTGMVAGT